jgi:hypothetical protein
MFADFENKTATDDNKDLDYMRVDQHIELQGRVGRARLSELYGDLFFEWTGDGVSGCNQVYHIDTGPNDYTTFRRLSTGIGVSYIFGVFSRIKIIFLLLVTENRRYGLLRDKYWKHRRAVGKESNLFVKLHAQAHELYNPGCVRMRASGL